MCLLMALALTPGFALFHWAQLSSAHDVPLLHYFFLALSFATAYFLYGFSLIILLPLANRILFAWPKPWKGPYYSIETIPWSVHNGLVYLMRYTFLDFITPTPLNILFLRLMRMKIGRGALINTSYISDPSLIEIGEKATIGGSVTLCAHYGVGGKLVLAPVKIGSGATLGLKVTILGGVEVGEGARVLPNSAVLPHTKIPAFETWGGIPARKLEPSEF
jgi:hypothetical protein